MEKGESGDSAEGSPFLFSCRRNAQKLKSRAGNGGTMGVASRKQAAISESPVKGSGKKTAGKKASGRGTSMLNEAAGKTLEENSSKIAKSLLKSTLGGNASSARLLVSLAEGPAESGKAGMKRRLRSIATKLAAEPEWSGETMEAATKASAEKPAIAG